MSSTNIKEELDLEVESSNDKGNSKASIRLLEFRIANSMDSTYWKNVEKQLKLEGKYFRTGHFSEAENNQLTKNWKRLIKKYPLDNPAAILRKNICPEAKETIKAFINETNFYINLGHKINRSPYAVYVRARRLFNNIERVGKYNEDEVEKLQDLESSLGNKWQKIGRKLGRCPSSAFKKCHSLKKDVVKGRWTDEEDKQLKDAVSMIMNEKKEEGVKKTKEETFFKLQWEKISDHVPTRNSKQCRERWMLHEQIGDDETKFKRRNNKFGKLLKVKLVNELISLDPIDESAIDWMQLHSHFPQVPSPQSLYQKWYDIKRVIPKYKSMELKEILAIAKEKILAKKVKDEIIDDDSDDDCNETNKQNQTQNISGASKSKSKKFSQVDEASRNGDNKLEDLNIKTEDEDDDDNCQVENPDDDAIGICLETVKLEPIEEIYEEIFLQEDSGKKKKSKKSKKSKSEDEEKDESGSVEVTSFQPPKKKKRKNETPTEDDAETNEGIKGKRKKLFRNHQTPLRENRGIR